VAATGLPVSVKTKTSWTLSVGNGGIRDGRVLPVNQHAKITRERVKSTSKSFHPICKNSRYLAGATLGDNNGTNSRNQATSFR
jgi:hypothetical protein